MTFFGGKESGYSAAFAGYLATVCVVVVFVAVEDSADDDNDDVNEIYVALVSSSLIKLEISIWYDNIYLR